MAYTCQECGLAVYRVLPGDGFTSCDCIRCRGCGDLPDDCICHDEDDLDEEVWS